MDLQISNETLAKLDMLEQEIRKLKKAEEDFEAMKNELYDAMEAHGVDSITTNGGLCFKKVSGTPEKTEIILKFDEDKFKLEHLAMYKKYISSVEKVTKARKGYLRMTLSKEEE